MTENIDQINDSLPHGILKIDEDFNVKYANIPAARILLESSTPLELNHNLFNQIYHRSLMETVSSSFKNKVNFSREFNLSGDRIVQIDGVYKNDCIILSIYNVSQFKELEKHQRQFVANVSHELKTPLTAIIGYTEAILDDETLSRKVQVKFLDVIFRQSLRLSQIVNDLLTLSNLEKEESSDEGLDLVSQSILPILENAIDVCEFKALEKNISIKLSCGKDLPNVDVNGSLFEQAMVNLIDNAVKFTPLNGAVVINIEKINNNLVIKVTDEGTGVPEKYHTRIFERFFSVDKGRSRKLGGSGLGLSIVKHIVINHNGEVFVKNNKVVGSVFHILLPIYNKGE